MSDIRQLYPYQQNAIDKSIAAYKAGRKRQYIAHATGLGKTVLIVNLVEEYRKTGIDLGQVVIIVPSGEIARQTEDEIKASFGDTKTVGVEMSTKGGQGE